MGMWPLFNRQASSLSYEPNDRDPNPTIFQWSRNRSLVPIAAFLFFSVLLHGTAFYLFQVVYPSPAREKPRADVITLLDASDPKVRTLLQRVDDRISYLSPPSSGMGVRLSIDELPVRFVPSFQSVEVAPEPLLNAWSVPPSIPSDFQISHENRGEQSGGAQSIASAIELLPGEALFHRREAPWSILGDYLSLAEQFPEMTLNVKVDREGRVTVNRVDGELTDQGKDEIKQIVESALRYVPASEETVGELTIRRKEGSL